MVQSKLVHFDEVRNNTWKSLFLFFIFLLLIAGLGLLVGLIWGNLYFGLILALVFGFAYGLIAYFAGGNMLMALAGAKPVTKKEYPYLYHTVEGLALAAGVPTPKAYVIDDPAPNAFATGRDPEHGAVAVTTGLLQKLNREELEGVLAHEIAHIRYYDIRSMMIAAVMVGVIILLSDFMLRSFIFGGMSSGGGGNRGGGAQLIFILIGVALAILAPLIGEIIRLSISRKREYAADAGAAVLTRNPRGLANALRKISKDPNELRNTNKATAHLYISTPFRKKGFMRGLFSTHPPVEERIKRLEAM